jgi:hypothetical protein
MPRVSLLLNEELSAQWAISLLIQLIRRFQDTVKTEIRFIHPFWTRGRTLCGLEGSISHTGHEFFGEDIEKPFILFAVEFGVAKASTVRVARQSPEESLPPRDFGWVFRFNGVRCCECKPLPNRLLLCIQRGLW